jgi:multiple sugar transport system permease protein
MTQIQLSKIKRIDRLGKSNFFNVIISILPITLLCFLIIVYPLLNIFFHSFTSWKISGTKFIGFNNYLNLITSGTLFLLLKNNFLLLLAIPIQVFLALFIAYFLYEEVWCWKFFRILFYLPAVLSSVVIGFLFRTFFSLNGPLNELLKFLGLNFLVINWLGKGSTAFIVVIFALIWSQFGIPVLIFLSGMDSIEKSVIESAMVDGASWWKRFFKIILPLIIGQIEFYSIVLVIIFFTASFGFIFSITSGGPGYATTTLEYMIYLKAFETNLLGQAAALATILFVIVLVIITTILKIFRKLGEWQE